MSVAVAASDHIRSARYDMHHIRRAAQPSGSAAAPAGASGSAAPCTHLTGLAAERPHACTLRRCQRCTHAAAIAARTLPRVERQSDGTRVATAMATAISCRHAPTRRGDSLATTAVAGNWSAALKHARCIGCELLRTAANNNFNTLLSGSSTRPHAEHRHTNTHQTETSHTTHLTHSRSETFSLVATHVGEATPNPLQE